MRVHFIYSLKSKQKLSSKKRQANARFRDATIKVMGIKYLNVFSVSYTTGCSEAVPTDRGKPYAVLDFLKKVYVNLKHCFHKSEKSIVSVRL